MLPLVYLFLAASAAVVGRVEGGNVLVAYSHDEKSHIWSMSPYLSRLAAAGHKLTILATDSDAEAVTVPFPAEVVHIRVPPAHLRKALKKLWLMEPHNWGMTVVHYSSDNGAVDVLNSNPDAIAELLNRTFDLVIVDEIFTIHGMVLARILRETQKVPHIIFSTSFVGAESNIAEMALGQTPVLGAVHGTILPSGDGDVYDITRFFLRIYNTLEVILEYLALKFLPIYGLPYKFPPLLGFKDFSTHEVVRTAQLHLREAYDRLGRIVSVGNDVYNLGAHCKPFKNLTGEFLDFVEDPSSLGTIYMAFGSIANLEDSPDFVFEAVFAALNEFTQYRVVISMKPLTWRKMPKIGRHIKISRWVPQQALLHHPKTVLFFSHGGLKSFKEGFCSGTPVVIMPILAEQGVMARIAMELGIGTCVNKYSITKENLVQAFNRVLNDPSYQVNIHRLLDINGDRIMPALNEGAWLAGRIIRRRQKGGFSVQEDVFSDDRSLLTFRRKGISMFSAVYFNFDWLAVLWVLLAIVSVQ